MVSLSMPTVLLFINSPPRRISGCQGAYRWNNFVSRSPFLGATIEESNID